MIQILTALRMMKPLCSRLPLTSDASRLRGAHDEALYRIPKAKRKKKGTHPPSRGNERAKETEKECAKRKHVLT
jgi:hypothetical protein